MSNQQMTFQEAIKVLGIEDYGERIFKSNSRGELSHLDQYVILAEEIIHDEDDAKRFRNWFISVVQYCKDNWERPESVYQHIVKIYAVCVEYELNNPES